MFANASHPRRRLGLQMERHVLSVLDAFVTARDNRSLAIKGPSTLTEEPCNRQYYAQTRPSVSGDDSFPYCYLSSLSHSYAVRRRSRGRKTQSQSRQSMVVEETKHRRMPHCFKSLRQCGSESSSLRHNCKRSPQRRAKQHPPMQLNG